MASPPDQVDFKAGDVLAGKYRIERVLGAGGMGVVVAAHHLQLDERVALKFLLPQAVRSQETVARFVREARAAVKIKSEHVARVTDVGQLENGSPYMVMEYLEGSDLSGWLAKRGALPFQQAVDFVLQTCEALADAHALGIVHRDLKPANLFCIQRTDGQLSIKVLDFGISKITTPGDAGHGMTKTTALMGSPLYMSPEQMTLSKGVDARTDIWALGIILFELVTGRPPFDAEAVTELAIKVATEPAPLLRAVRHDAPQGLEQVIARCLEKDRTKRFQNVGELALALKDFGTKGARISVDRVLGTLRQAGLSGDVAPPSQEPPQGGGSLAATLHETMPRTAASWGHTAPGTKPGGKGGMGIAVASVVGVLAVVGGAFFHYRGPTAPVPGAVAAVPPPVAEPPAVQPTPPPTADTVVTHTAAVAALPAASSVARQISPPAPPPPGGASIVAQPTPAPPSGGIPAGVKPPSVPPPSPSPSPPAAKANCNPPYVIDSAGHRQYKPECLN